MFVIICIVVILLVLLVGLFLMKVRIDIQFSQINNDTDGYILASTLFGLIKHKRRLLSLNTTMSPEGPAIKSQHKTQDKPRDTFVLTSHEVGRMILNWPKWLDVVRDIWRHLEDLLRRVSVDVLHVSGTIGTGEVISTGLAYGAFWSAVSAPIGRLSFLAKFRSHPDVQLLANFQKPEFKLTIQCIASVRLGYAIITAMHLVRVWRRRINDGSPNPGTHEDGDGEHSRDGRRQHDYRRSG